MLEILCMNNHNSHKTHILAILDFVVGCEFQQHILLLICNDYM